MTETASGEDLSVHEALNTIDALTSYEEPLRRRTEGVTWMIWGLVTAAIQLSFEALPPRMSEGSAPATLSALIVFGWPVVGVAFTYAVWRIAVLGHPGMKTRQRGSLKGVILWLPLLYAAWGLIVLLGPGLEPAVTPLLSIGVAWTLLGGLNVFRATPVGRRVVLAFGAAILVAALAFAFQAPSMPHGGWEMTALLIIGVGGGAPLAGGLWQTLRG